jgi:hypothetical protein
VISVKYPQIDGNNLMEISLADIVAIVSIVIIICAAIIGYCIRIETKFRKLEDEINIFKPIKDILRQKGEEHVISIFNERKT